MLIKLLSDLHLEGEPEYRPPLNSTDSNTILVLAGDVCEFQRTHILLPFLSEMNERFKKIIYVPGNHEYYRGHIYNSLNKIKELTLHLDKLHILNNETITIDGVNFIGSTCWTSCNNANPMTMFNIQQAMNDFNYIRQGNYHRLTAMDTVRLHDTAVKFIISELSSKADETSVVITHHAPSIMSISEYYRQSSNVNDAYFSDLTNIMDKYNPSLWLHGHVHNSFDYEVYDTRVVANPRGYPRSGYLPENGNFNEELRLMIGNAGN